MLFSSYEFIFIFFPLVLLTYFFVGRCNSKLATGFLSLASLFFYGWWSLEALPLLLASIAFNFAISARISPGPGRVEAWRKVWLRLALLANLGLLAVFKYADFFVENINRGLAAAHWQAWVQPHLILPIGISFYTFTQIAFLVDSWRGLVRERRFADYLLFVTYFPHLIAGPVLHHRQMMPQFARPDVCRFHAGAVFFGLATFTLGLAKKLLIADPMGLYADIVFGGVDSGLAPSATIAWLGALAYTLQIYFDFSGYSDMAVGLSMCMGVRLPINFDSPYQSRSIIEFWRRWHISLSTFLRDYLYVPLGGNRLGARRRYVNLLITMILGGLWHGAAWTFVLWGAMHGLFLVVNHLWRQWRDDESVTSLVSAVLAWGLTFVCVTLAWVMFRAHNVSTAVEMYSGMFGLNPAMPSTFHGLTVPYKQSDFYKILLFGLLVCFAAPSTATIVRKLVGAAQLTAASPRLMTAAAAIALGALFVLCALRLGTHSPFLYFQF